MTTTTRKYLTGCVLILFWMLAIQFYFPSCGAVAHGQKVINDTIPKTIVIKERELNKKIDTLIYCLSFIGRTMSVDEAINMQKLWGAAIGNLKSFATTDSIVFIKPKK